MPYGGSTFRITHTVIDGIHRINISGEVDIAAAPAFAQALHEANASSATSVIVDMAAVTFLDSAGIRVLMDAVSASRAGTNTLSFLRDYQPQIVRVLTLTGIIDQLPNRPEVPAGSRS
jgi:anti-sigma B factor antagonist